jgi:hypothetical protein
MTLREKAREIAKGIVPLGDVFECDIPLVIAGMRAALEWARKEVISEDGHNDVRIRLVATRIIDSLIAELEP